jgi:predicted nucleic acid-binding Zn ribbon protein
MYSENKQQKDADVLLAFIAGILITLVTVLFILG